MLKEKNEKAGRNTAVSARRLDYEKPAVVYEGYVTTRAGSPLRESEKPFDMLDYFLGNRNK